MSSDEPNFKFDETEYGFINSPYFAQKVTAEIKRRSLLPSLAFHILQSKYTYLALFFGLVLFPALVEANSLRSLCFY